MNTNKFIPSVNFHLWEPCNMRCKFCFATFQDVKQSILPKGHLPKEQAVQVVEQLAGLGFEKITFVGGEPTLCPWLSDLISVAKQLGLTTMVVSNGAKLTDKFLKENRKHLDWVTLSIDSLNKATNLSTGRAIVGKKALLELDYLNLVEKIKQYGYGLKINTVVNLLNYEENMNNFMRIVKPERWKVFQVLPILGQNDRYIDDFKITAKQFRQFLENHSSLEDFTKIIPEINQQMKGTYVMIDPAGRFFGNSEGRHFYSQPILNVGAKKAISEMNYDFEEFINRKGLYDWNRK